MIHSFVELALPVDDLLSARSEFLDLGFTELRVTDAWSHPYTALRLGQLSIGLHQGFVDTPSLVLTRPSLASSIWSATHAPDWTQIQLDDDLFNFARCDSPSGLGLVLVEATTHASAEPTPVQELSWRLLRCTTPALTVSAAFWAPFAVATSELQTAPTLQLTLDIGALPLELLETPPAPPVLVLHVLNEAAFIARLAHHGFALSDGQHSTEIGRIKTRDGLEIAFTG